MDAGCTADIDDTARGAVLDAKIRRRGAHELEGRGVVEREDGIPLLIRHLVDDAVPGEPRVVDDDMDLAPAELRGLVDEGVDVGCVEHVARDGEGFAAGGVDGVGDGVGFVAVDVLDDDGGAFAGEELGGFGADALA